MSEPEKQETLVQFEVPPGYKDDARLDVYLTSHIQNATRSKVQAGIKEGRVVLNDSVLKRPSYRVQAGDRIDCTILRPPPIEILPQDIPLDITYEDDDLIIVNKPAGMVVHPGYGNRDGTLVNALLHHVRAQPISLETGLPDDFSDDDLGLSILNASTPGIGRPGLRPGIVHRLDKDTTGLLLVAKNDVAHARLAKQFADRTIFRRYRALVWGIPDPASGTVESYLGRDPRDRRRMATVPEESGKLAITHYDVIEAFGYTALVEFRLETGRTHQIRIHALQIGHPVFGDTTYGGDRIRFGTEHGSRRSFYMNLFARLPRQALHAFALGFVHPSSGEEMKFEAPIPPDMQHVIERVGTVDQF
ncbi:MAG: RluA family pseudouridine synthase [Bacteroidetes bacterium]|nr:MAG: RluA family pseudouridine synthase [Bacteroidota bacterium]